MAKMIIAGAALALLLVSGILPAAAHHSRYYEWSTTRPYSGWAGIGTKSYYCDYIKYPVRKCRHKRVCRHGNCWSVRTNCRTVGWNIRQSCY